MKWSIILLYDSAPAWCTSSMRMYSNVSGGIDASTSLFERDCTVANVQSASRLLAAGSYLATVSVPSITFLKLSMLLLSTGSLWTMYSTFIPVALASNAERYVLPEPVAEITRARSAPSLLSFAKESRASFCILLGWGLPTPSGISAFLSERDFVKLLRSSYILEYSAIHPSSTIVARENTRSNSLRTSPMISPDSLELILRFHSMFSHKALFVRLLLPISTS